MDLDPVINLKVPYYFKKAVDGLVAKARFENALSDTLAAPVDAIFENKMRGGVTRPGAVEIIDPGRKIDFIATVGRLRRRPVRRPGVVILVRRLTANSGNR